ncbi:MAG: exodeoxyribonuclease VII large subunit [Cystobacterineae bacterium]|nr:exodeoxyribonuclease VII large subunit [Cystobacterineae bacterium]
MKQKELFESLPLSPKPAATPVAPLIPKPLAQKTQKTAAVPHNQPTLDDQRKIYPQAALCENKLCENRPADSPPHSASDSAPYSAPKRQPLSVSALTQHIKQAIDSRLGSLWVKGELSNFKGPNARGHLYFSLKDEKASVEVKMWASQAKHLRFKLEEGMALLVVGTVEVYAPMGRYSLIASHIEPDGLGAQALAFEQLKARLAQEGLWGEGRKRPRRPLPFLPRRIGVVTSITGAALRDFLKVLLRRNPRLSVLVRDARVQGAHAAAEMVEALKQLYATDVDVVVLARGGGSAEDLAAFNEEALARTLFESPVPSISAVGHETDIPLCDLVADIRAPTPSVAAELLSPIRGELELQLVLKQRRLKNAQQRLLALARSALDKRARTLAAPRRAFSTWRLQLSALEEALQAALTKRLKVEHKNLRALLERLSTRHPRLFLLKGRQRLEALRQRLMQGIGQTLESRHAHQRLLAKQLHALSPLAVLGRGYALLKEEATGRWLLSPEGLVVGQALEIHMAQGRVLRARITAPAAPFPYSPTQNMPEEAL